VIYKNKKHDIVQICRVFDENVNSNRSLRNVCWTIFLYNTPIIFARRKQLCACAHKLWKGSIDCVVGVVVEQVYSGVVTCSRDNTRISSLKWSVLLLPQNTP